MKVARPYFMATGSNRDSWPQRRRSLILLTVNRLVGLSMRVGAQQAPCSDDREGLPGSSSLPSTARDPSRVVDPPGRAQRRGDERLSAVQRFG